MPTLHKLCKELSYRRLDDLKRGMAKPTRFGRAGFVRRGLQILEPSQLSSIGSAKPNTSSTSALAKCDVAMDENEVRFKLESGRLCPGPSKPVMRSRPRSEKGALPYASTASRHP